MKKKLKVFLPIFLLVVIVLLAVYMFFTTTALLKILNADVMKLNFSQPPPSSSDIEHCHDEDCCPNH